MEAGRHGRAALDAAELLILRAAWLEDKHKPYEKESAMAKLFASDTAMWAAVEGVQVLGRLRLLQGIPDGTTHA